MGPLVLAGTCVKRLRLFQVTVRSRAVTSPLRSTSESEYPIALRSFHVALRSRASTVPLASASPDHIPNTPEPRSTCAAVPNAFEEAVVKSYRLLEPLSATVAALMIERRV